MSKVLLIEDDTAIQELVRYTLEKEGFNVLIADNGEEGLEMAKRDHPDLLLLDLMLPLLSGLEVCKLIRAQESTARLPIIMLSARDDVIDKVIGLELGADDYLSKPFSPRELVARIRARLREEQRNRNVEHKPLKWGALEIWPENYIVKLNDQPVNLTAKEFELLLIFVSHPQQVFSRDYLTQKVWGYHFNIDTRTIDVHISNLRNKLKAIGTVIESIRGVGYRFAPSQSEPKT